MPRLILLRHGESVWNLANIYTGWVDVELSKKGEAQAIAAGQVLLRENIRADVCFTSFLRRAIKTLWLCLETSNQMHIPIQTSWQLNERHYGALEGRNKQQTVNEYGAKQVHEWRRSFSCRPPLCDPDSPFHASHDPKYASLPDAAVTAGESLEDTMLRVEQCWQDRILPELVKGQTVLVSAHGNSLRALIKFLELISDEDIAKLNVPLGVPMVFDFEWTTTSSGRDELQLMPFTSAPLVSEPSQKLALRFLCSVEELDQLAAVALDNLTP